MKTIIIYGSTYGFTKECSIKLSEQIVGEVLIVNAASDTLPKLDEFDNVVIGGSIYMGKIQKKLKNACISNIEILKNKRVALFVCCGSPENLQQTMNSSFPKELLNIAIAKECFGGVLRIEKMNFLYKILVKAMISVSAKEGKPLPHPIFENIAKLSNKINEYQN